MQRDNLRKRENDETAAKAGISPSPFGFPSAHPFPTPSPLLPAFAFYYSAEVCGLKGLVDALWIRECYSFLQEVTATIPSAMVIIS